jgi:TetR/AcrR family transcriptional regulator
LYRHFASKAQMYEGLIEFIEGSLFSVINQITAEEQNGLKQAHAVLSLLLSFAEKNPGMTRVLIGDVLMNEDPRLQARINQLHDRLESSLKQCLRVAATQQHDSTAEAQDFSPHANLWLSFVVGRWQQYAKSGFKRRPGEFFEKQWPLMI